MVVMETDKEVHDSLKLDFHIQRVEPSGSTGSTGSTGLAGRTVER